jgi:acetyltransferase-like isoleucine patch superfamily enzyme
MKYSQLIEMLMFDYGSMTIYEITTECNGMPPKLLRWLGAHHPDNRCRKLFFETTNVVIGEDSVINSGFIVSDNYKQMLTIGRRVAISPSVVVICASSPNNSLLLQSPGFSEKYVRDLPVFIDDDAWIGAGSIILPGVRIGKKSIVGAGSVVSRDVPDETVVAGVPAKIVQRVSFEQRA